MFRNTDDDRGATFYHQDDAIVAGLTLLDVWEEVYGKPESEVMAFVDKIARNHLKVDGIEAVNFEIYDGELHIFPRTIPRENYLELLDEIESLRAENTRLRRHLIDAHLNEATDNYDWDDDSLPDGPEGPIPSY